MPSTIPYALNLPKSLRYSEEGEPLCSWCDDRAIEWEALSGQPNIGLNYRCPAHRRPNFGSGLVSGNITRQHKAATGRWCTSPQQPDECKTCFDVVSGGLGVVIAHLPATGFYQELPDDLGRAWRQGVCDRKGCRSRVYAAELGCLIVRYSAGS